VADSCEHSNELSCSINGGIFRLGELMSVSQELCSKEL
jgi:hypothetical protein